MAPISHPARTAGSRLATLLATGALAMLAAGPRLAVAANDATTPGGPALKTKHPTRPRLDFSGRKRVGVASFYASWFAGRKMADGVRMNPRGNNAASRTLPLGTIARVTDLGTHRSAVVVIQDRGPYVRGRIVDLSPSTARRIGITRKIGIAKVRVTPLAIPPRNGRIKVANEAHPRSLL